VIAERVRARLGGVSSHPGAIDVMVRDGTVTLRGPILADEIPAVVRAVTAVRGVVHVDDLLDAHLEAGDVPALQGVPAERHEPDRAEGRRRPWSPTARLLTGVGGAAVATWGLRRTGTIGTLTGGAGLALVARAASNVELTRLFGLGAGHDAVTLQKTIEVGAPIEDVWDLWSRYEELPRFMSHVRSVRRADDGSSHWTVDGPGGMPLSWHTVETLRVPRETIAWKTMEGAPVAHAGMVQFAPTPGGTRIHVRFHYTPPAGALGHALAAMLGADPKRAMDEDLVRFKSLLEEGSTTAHRRTVRRDELH
jgi:uncharacterized membrane protein